MNPNLKQSGSSEDPEQRYQSVRDLVIDLHAPPPEVAPAPAASWLVAVAGVSTVALIAAGAGWYNATRPSPPLPLIRFNAEIEPGAPLARVAVFGYTGGNMLALSPDGARLALTLRGADGKVRLHTRLQDQGKAIPLADTENAYSPFFSPAGDWIAFFAEGKLKKIAVAGGAPQTLCDAPIGFGGSWGDDGNIIAALNRTGGLWRVPSAGGAPVPVTKLNPGESTHRWPQVLPGSQAALFTSGAQVGAGYDDANIDAISLSTGERKTILRQGFFARFLGDATGSGHLLYLHQATLFAVPFHAGRLALGGSSTPILEDVSSTMTAGGDVAIAQNGTLVYLAGKTADTPLPISWVDSGGKSQPLSMPPGQYFSLRFSPDGQRLAFAMSNDRGADIWVKDLDRATPSRLSFLPGLNFFPVWTPGGKNLVFRSSNPAAPGLYGVRSDGSGEPKRLTDGKFSEHPYSISPDGKRLAVHQVGNSGSWDIFTIPVEGGAGPDVIGVRPDKAELFLGTHFDERNPTFSPDGHWLAYASNESGVLEIYVRPFPGPGGRWMVSAGGGHFPVWSRGGRELLFETPDQRVMAVSYTARGDSLALGQPRAWTGTALRTPLRATSNAANYDLAPDGRRLAAIVGNDASGERPVTHVTFLLNFSDELRRKAPEGK